MATAKPKVEYTKPTSQLDLEARLGSEAEAPVFNESVNPAPATDEGFVGVSPEYQNYANDTDKPLEAEGGADALAEEAFDDAYGDSSGEVSADIQERYDVITSGTQGVSKPAEASTEAPTE